MRSGNSEQGSTFLIIAGTMASALSLFLLNAATSKSSMKASEIRVQKAVSDAQLANVSAISYLGATLEKSPTQTALMKVEANKIVGPGNAVLTVNDDGVVFKQQKVSRVSSKKADQIFSGNATELTPENTTSTRLEVLETISGGAVNTFVVRATTDAEIAGTKIRSVSTTGRVKVASALAPPPPPPPLVPPVASGGAPPPPLVSPAGAAGVEAVDGQEVLRSCQACSDRAAALAASAGFKFKVDLTKTKDLGFYKIDPAQNLCDIHFLAEAGDTIQDHKGVSSILTNQIAVYCPCDCGAKK